MTRNQLIAHFILHGWEPASAMGRLRGNVRPIAETGLMHPTLGFLRVKRGAESAIISKRGGMPTETMHKRRERREWKQVSLPRLRLMYMRLEQLNADDAKEMGHAS